MASVQYPIDGSHRWRCGHHKERSTWVTQLNAEGAYLCHHANPRILDVSEGPNKITFVWPQTEEVCLDVDPIAVERYLSCLNHRLSHHPIHERLVF